MADFIFTNHGSIWLCEPQSPEALAHLQAHLDIETQFLGEALAVEPRYVAGLADQLEDDGWSVEF